MILLDYSVSPLWYSAAAPITDFRALTEFELSGEVFFGDATIIVSGRDLSWHADLPLLDFARSFYLETMSLSPLRPESYVRTLDYNDRLYLSLISPLQVRLSPTYSAVNAITSLAELKHAVALFGMRVYEDFVSLYPDARCSGINDSWYPLEKMAKTAGSRPRP